MIAKPDDLLTQRAPARDQSLNARPPGLWMQGWQRFRRNRTGMLGLTLVALVVLVALTCPLLAPYAPNDQSAMLSFG